MKRIVCSLAIVAAAWGVVLQSYPHEERFLTTPEYLQERALAQETEKALCSLLAINGNNDFDHIVALISRCKPVMVMVYHHGDKDEEKSLKALHNTAKFFKGAVACATMECGTAGSENARRLKELLGDLGLKKLDSPAFLIFKDGDLYQGTSAIMQGYHSENNLEESIKEKFFVGEEGERGKCAVCPCDFTVTAPGEKWGKSGKK
ncbi:MAG: hypothetical protein WC365_04730 [Candidatus Babeliales bacterium]|jgi:hypothetical protein